MAERVVHALEPIEIKKKQRQRYLVAIRPLERMPEAVTEQHPVR